MSQIKNRKECIKVGGEGGELIGKKRSAFEESGVQEDEEEGECMERKGSAWGGRGMLGQKEM